MRNYAEAGMAAGLMFTLFYGLYYFIGFEVAIISELAVLIIAEVTR